ncbi:hypothetical protein [Streptomyces sp. NPDC093225]|uniref:hypothetical protein n=1 Tax=Streptomyces sp. NPDC093225 TaxID=3366034 RepID=UPI00382389B6
MRELAGDGFPPQIIEGVDMKTWRRASQELFTVQSIKQWIVPSRLWREIETFDEMRQLRAMIQAHPVLASRVDTLVGTVFSSQRRELSGLVVSLVQEVVFTSGTWTFDAEAFDAAYERVEADLVAETVTFTDFVPLLGFDGDQSVDGQEVAPGVTLRKMTDSEVCRAAQRAAIPIDQYLTTAALQISRFNQWALTTEHTHALRTGDDDTSPPQAAPQLPIFGASAPMVLASIRLICGGSATTSYGLRSDSLGQGLSAALIPIGPTDPSRPSVLAGQEMLHQVRAVFQHITHPRVTADRPLCTAARQVVLAGSRGLVEDRLLNLITAAEALFITRPRRRDPNGRKGVLLAAGAADRLAGDRTLGAPSKRNIKALMQAVYKWRNAEVHGDQPPAGPLRLLGGTETRDLTAVAADLDRMMRRALLLTLEETSQGTTRPQRTRQRS